MKYLRALWPWAVAVVVLLAYGCEREANGELRATLATLSKERDALAKRGAVERLVFVHDTVRVSKTVTKYETLRDSLFVTDTLLRHDTAFVTLVASADTAIRACREVVNSCARNLAIADSLHVVDQRLIRTLQRAQPSFLRRWSERLMWGAVGYTISSVTH